jgi:hypothetical protein
MAVKLSRTTRIRMHLARLLIRLAYKVGGIEVEPNPTRQDKRRMGRGRKVMSTY